MENDVTVWNFAAEKAEILRGQGRASTAVNYCKTMRCLSRYCADASLSFSDITEDFVGGFNAFLKEKGMRKSTVSFYNRSLRSLYNQASKEGLVRNSHPFDYVYTDVDTKISPVTLLTTDNGDSFPVCDITKEELLRRYLTLQGKYNNLVNRLQKFNKYISL